MPEQGRLVEWNDERGFGFISPLGSDSRVFVHVSAFPREQRRPVATDLVTFTTERDERGRPRATDVRFLTPIRTRREQARPLGRPALIAAAAFLLLVVVLFLAGLAPAWSLGLYAGMSVLAFVMYGADKAAAQTGEWRTSEASLHAVSLLGGWPGALVAQHVFHHKTRKQSFRLVFWITVAANCALFAWVVGGRRFPA